MPGACSLANRLVDRHHSHMKTAGATYRAIIRRVWFWCLKIGFDWVHLTLHQNVSLILDNSDMSRGRSW